MNIPKESCGICHTEIPQDYPQICPTCKNLIYTSSPVNQGSKFFCRKWKRHYENDVCYITLIYEEEYEKLARKS